MIFNVVIVFIPPSALKPHIGGNNRATPTAAQDVVQRGTQNDETSANPRDAAGCGFFDLHVSRTGAVSI